MYSVPWSQYLQHLQPTPVSPLFTFVVVSRVSLSSGLDVWRKAARRFKSSDFRRVGSKGWCGRLESLHLCVWLAVSLAVAGEEEMEEGCCRSSGREREREGEYRNFCGRGREEGGSSRLEVEVAVAGEEVEGRCCRFCGCCGLGREEEVVGSWGRGEERWLCTTEQERGLVGDRKVDVGLEVEVELGPELELEDETERRAVLARSA